jgi:hypothetical protein
LEERRLRLRVLLAAGISGGVTIALLRYVLMPAVERNLTDAQLEWLASTFQSHPYLTMVGIVAVSALLGLPMLLIVLRIVKTSGVRR